MTPPDGTGTVPVAPGGPAGRTPDGALASAVLAVASPEPFESTLRRIVEAAVRQVDATYGAMGVLAADRQRLDHFVVAGMTPEERQRIGRPPSGHGLLGLLAELPEVLRLDDLGAHPDSVGFPPGHLPMRSFLGVPIRVRDTVFGILYLTEKRTGAPFTGADAEAVQALAAVAGLAVEKARLAEHAELRRTWVQAGTEAATALLASFDTAAVLRDVAARVGDLLDADFTGVLLPSADDDESLTIAAAVGPGAADLEGVRVPVADTHAGRVHRSGQAEVLADIGARPLRGRRAAVAMEITVPYGPGIMAPLGTAPSCGVFGAMRAAGRPPFDPALREPFASFAAQTAVALALARTQERERRLQMQADRDRIARDLHDHVVQRVFATALSLDRLSRSLQVEHPEAAVGLARSVDELDSTIAEIRAAIFELQEQERVPPATLRAQLADVVRQVTEGRQLRRDVRLRGAVEALPADLVSDVVAVVRELVTNVVRHASARRVTVTVHADEEVRVVVTDDGVGLHPASARSGLANLADRAERRGGRLATVPRSGGTQVRWIVPVG